MVHKARRQQRKPLSNIQCQKKVFLVPCLQRSDQPCINRNTQNKTKAYGWLWVNKQRSYVSTVVSTGEQLVFFMQTELYL